MATFWTTCRYIQSTTEMLKVALLALWKVYNMKNVSFRAVTNDRWSQKLLRAADKASPNPDGSATVVKLDAYVTNNSGPGYVIVDGERWYASADDIAAIRRNVERLNAGDQVAPLADKTVRLGATRSRDTWFSRVFGN